MKRLRLSRLCSLFLSFSLLIAQLPLIAMVEHYTEPQDAPIVTAVNKESYICLQKKSHNIAEFIFEIARLDKNIESPIHLLKNYISDGFTIVNKEEMLRVLEYAEWLLEQEDITIEDTYRHKLLLSLENLMQAIIDDTLLVDMEKLSEDKRLPLWVINKKIKVEGKARFEREAIFYDKTRFHDPARFYKRAHFKNNIVVDGAASLQDVVADNLSVTNATIDNLTLSGGIAITDLTLDSLTVTDAVVDNLQVNNCMPHLCVQDLTVTSGSVSGTLSINDAVIETLDLTGGLIISDLTLDTATITDAVVDNLQVNNCMPHLCVQDLTVTNGSVSGTLSINDAVIQTLDLTGGLIISDLTLDTATITDAVIDNLQVNNCVSQLCIDDLTVTNCIPELCVTRATLTDLAVLGTLTATDAFIEHLGVAQNTLHFYDSSNINYVGMTAPTTVPTSYTVNLPTNAPTSNQILRANNLTPTNLEWATEGSSVPPTTSGIIYVTTYGNDTTGDGSFDNPFASLAKAVDVANSIALTLPAVLIMMGPGAYVENNSVGPITVTSSGISIVGGSATSVIIIPGVPSNDLLQLNETVTIRDVTFASILAPSTATGINFTNGQLTQMNNVNILYFQSGIVCSGPATATYSLNNCLFVGNGTALTVNNTVVQCNSCTFFGSGSLTTPSNIGMVVTGAAATVIINSGSCVLCQNGFEVNNNATLSISATTFKLNIADVIASNAAHMTLTGCSFELTNSPSDIDVQVSGAGTIAYMIGCEFNGNSGLGVPEATGIFVSDNAFVEIDGGTLTNYMIGIIVGNSSDTASTNFSSSAFSVRNCTTDIQQQGLATLNFNSGVASGSKISINDATNVSLSFFDLEHNNALTIGSTADMNTDLINIEIGTINNPNISYDSSLYSAQAVGYINGLGNPSTLFAQSDDDAKLAAITTDRTDIAGVRLMSDQGVPVGGTSALRGWDIYKKGTTAELAFDYQNSDPLLLGTTLPYTVMQLDGTNNQVQLPTTGTQIVFGGDTNLYRSSANVLQTDDNFIVGTLTPDRVVITSALTNQLASSITTATEVSYLSGVTSPIQPQLNNKVSRSGDTMTGTLQLPAGTTVAPSLVFTGSTTTGLSASAGNLSLSTNAAERLKISSAGIVSINSLVPAGIVHNDLTGNLSSSLIVNADIDPAAAIADTKLNTISTAGKVANSATTATNVNTANAIVSRDASGNFNAGTITAGLIGNVIGNVTGSASNNVLKAGDSMTGTLNMLAQNEIRFQDATGGEYAGINAPATIPTSYTLSLPSAAPTINQTLRAGSVTATNLQWITEGGSIPPSVSETIYVTKYGNDITGDGSFDEPFASLSKAINVANGLASASNPIAIFMGPGIYIEDNSAGPLTVATDGITIIGNSFTSAIIIPATGNDLLLSNQPIVISQVSFIGSGSGIALSLSNGSLTECQNVRFIGFQTGVQCSGGAFNNYAFGQCYFVGNNTGIELNGTVAECYNCTIIGNALLTSPANTGVKVNGTGSVFIMNGGVFGICSVALDINNGGATTLTAIEFESNTFDIIQSSGAQVTLSGSNFQYTTSPSDLKFLCTDPGSFAQITGCRFNGTDSSGNPQGTGIAITNGAVMNMNGCGLSNYGIAVTVGSVTDTSSTIFNGASTSIRNNATYDILQQGSSTLNFTAGTLDGSKVVINDPTNVNMAFFDIDDDNALTIGSGGNTTTSLLQAYIDPINHPKITYEPSLYSTQGIGFENLFGNPSTLFVEANADAKLAAVTTINTDIAGIRLVSDTASPVGGTTALRGWDINKNGTTAELSFNYQNSDVSQSIVPEYTVMQLDGANNLVQLPTAGTKIVFDSDTNLYRSAANVLKTDDNLIVAGIAPNSAVATDGSSQLVASATTATELGYVNGVTSPIQTQLNNKVSKSGDTMTGALQLPAGAAATPSLVFTGSTTTGLSAQTANTLSFSTAGTEKMSISSAGVVSIANLTPAGVVHNDGSGNLSSSLIVNADITDGTIANAKLATVVTSSDVSNTIVLRDGSKNFATNMITLNGSVVNPTDAATKAYVDAAIGLGFEVKEPALVASTTPVATTGLYTLDGVALSANDRVLLVGQGGAVPADVNNGLWLAQVGAWTRPADFATGTPAGTAYVLVTSGNTYAGASWVCSTPTAIIDTNPLVFSQFSLPSSTTAANIGTGTGLVFANKTGVTLNFRSLAAGSHLTYTTNTNDVSLTTDATNANTASTIVARDASGNFSAGTITANLTGSASNNVLKAGDTMTGSLTVPAGTAASPSLNFNGSTTTGLSAQTADTLVLSTAGTARMTVSPTGVVTVSNFTPTAGIIHNDTSGVLSSSLIVNADVSASAGIVDTKLATISTAGKVSNSATSATNANTANAIVSRDGSGNFNAGTITATLNGSATNNVLKAGDTMTGTLQLPAGTTALPSLVFTGSTTAGLSASAGNLSLSTNALERLKISSGGTVSVNAFTVAGVVHNDSSGNLSTSLIVNADIDPAAAISDTKLATISTAGKVANSATTATSANTANAIVARDASGNFSAGTITASLTGNVTGNVTGSASNNVLKAGDSMTGTLNMLAQNEIRFQDNTGGEYVGINAPTTVPTSYTLSLPSTVPTVGQTLKAGSVTPTNLQWVTEGGAITPATSRVIYVTKYGNDITGNGSFDTPYASLSKAINVANTLPTSAFNPTVISISAGVYAEDNTAGPLTITAQGISIIGDSSEAVYIVPMSLSNDLLLVTQSVVISNVSFYATGPSTAKGLSFNGGSFSNLVSVRVFNFQTGVYCTGGINNNCILDNCLLLANGTGSIIDSSGAEFNNCTILGSPVLNGPAANVGLNVTGTSIAVYNGGSCSECVTGFSISGGAKFAANAAGFNWNINDIIAASSALVTLSGCIFEFTQGSSDIDIQATDAGTILDVTGCNLNGKSYTGISQGTGIAVLNGALMTISGGNIQNYDTAIQIGSVSDTSSTQLNASAVSIRNSTTYDILQQGSTTLSFNAGTASGDKVSIATPTNVNLAFFDIVDNNALTIGSTANQNTILLQAAIAPTNHPSIEYLSSLYSTQAIGLSNLFGNPSTWFVEANADSKLAAVTTVRSNVAGIRLVSDTGSPVGGTSALRGWDINKNATTAELSFKYQNSDTVGQSAVPLYTVMQLDGVNNQLQLPTAGTKILFAGDTNLYRSTANVLKTDSNFIVGTLTPGRAVVTDASTNQLTSSSTTATEIGFVSGVTSSIQTQLNNKVSKSGDTMTGTLQLPAGTTALPSLVFTGSTTTGLSANTGDLSFSTNALERLKISSGGIVSIDAFTSAGVVHNDASGNLSSSLIVNADVSASAGIVDTKLATISTAGKVSNSATTATSANTANAIVTRDASGNFSVNEITIAGTVTNPTDAATKAYVDSSVASPGVSTNTPNTTVRRDGTGSFAAQVISLVDEVASGSIKVTAFAPTAGVVHNDTTGLFSSSLIVNADVSASAGIVDTKLATISTAGKVSNSATTATNANTANAIVARDGSGNFSAGTITANLTGNATTATTATNFSGSLSGDVTGTQSATVVSLVGGVTAANVASGANAANAATSANTASTIVKRDASGNFIAGTITANLTGNATTATTATNFSGSLSGDVTGTQSATVVSLVGGQTAANVATATVAANAATSANTASTIVKRDASGNFSAGTITASLTGNATTATTATNFSGSLSGDVTGTQGATVVSLVGGVTAANVASGANAANAATSANTASTIVKRDSSGNFSTTMITLTGTTTNATDAATKAYVDSVAGSPGVSTNTPNTTVKRDGTGSFAAQNISMFDAIISENISLQDSTSATVGNIVKNGTAFIHNFGTNNTFVGKGAGNFTMSGSGSNTGIGVSALSANTTGVSNTAVGTGALTANTTGANNTAVGSIALNNNSIGANNSALGTNALRFNTTGTGNTGIGTNALTTNTTGTNNTAIGSGSLLLNTIGTGNTAIGFNALNANTTALYCTAVGHNSLTANTTGLYNTAVGAFALSANTTGVDNTVVGWSSGSGITTGSNNVLLGWNLGNSITTGNNNIYIDGTGLSLGSSESDTIRIGNTQTACFIRGIYGVSVSSPQFVTISSNGQLGSGSGSTTFSAGSAASPSIQFTGSTNTGFSAATANTLSFDTNGVERMSISTTSIINTLPLCNQAVVVNTTLATGGTITTTAGTSILIINSGNTVNNCTIVYPPNPTDGQYFTIVSAQTQAINSITNTGGTGGAIVVNAIFSFSPSAAIGVSTNGVSATYIYNSANNRWYRIGRG